MIKNTLKLLFLSLIVAGCKEDDKSKLHVAITYVSVNDNKTPENVFTFGEIFKVNFIEVSGFVYVDGRVYPESVLHILDEKKDTIETSKGLFDEVGLGETVPNLAVECAATFSEAINKDYELIFEIKDSKGDKSFSYTMPFKIVPNDNFLVRSDGLEYLNIFLLDEITEKVITNNVVTAEKDLTIIYEGLTGFGVDEINFIYPAAAVKMIDAEGVVLMDKSNLFKDFETLGFNYEDAKLAFPIDIGFIPKAKTKNPVKLFIELTDLKSSNKLELETKLTLK